MLRDQTLTLLQKHGVALEAALDEQQLIDPVAIKTLIDAAGITPEDVVLEIGPGTGNITAELAAQAGRVVAVEKNPKFLPLLRERLADSKNLEAIEGDALSVPLPPFDVLVSNLPYAITEAVFQRLIRAKFKAASLLVSSTFASIITAAEGAPEYSKLTFEARLFFSVERVAEVGPEAYHPQPKTATAVVIIRPKPVDNPSEAVLRALLRQGDKKTYNALREAMISSTPAGYPSTKKAAKAAISRLELTEETLEKRVARLSLADLEILRNRLDHLSS